MKIICSFLVASCLLTGVGFGQEATAAKPPAQKVERVKIPLPIGWQATPDLQGLTWNRYEVPGYEILSIDDRQGWNLAQTINSMSDWTFTRWNLPPSARTKCMVLCVPNKELMKKLFGLEGSYGEVQVNKDGSVAYCLWLVLDTPPAAAIPPALTGIALRMFEKEKNIKLALWAHRGMSVLNATENQIRSNVARLSEFINRNDPMFFGDYLLQLKDSEWATLKQPQRELYDMEAAALTLMIRKEFGEKILHEFMFSDCSEASLKRCMGFNNYKEFDATFRRYMQHLTADVLSNKTPKSYLQITPAKS